MELILMNISAILNDAWTELKDVISTLLNEIYH